MTATYEQQGLQFLYPENWDLRDEDVSGTPWTVSLQSPGGGFWSLHAYPAEHSPETVAAEALAAMQAEYEDAEVEPLEGPWHGTPMQGFQLFFYCLDLLITARILCFKTPAGVLMVMWQAENREFDELEPVFQAITFSLIRSTVSP